MHVTLVVFGALAASAAAAPSPRPITVFLDRGGDAEIPRFGGGDRAWAGTVACVKQHFAPFQVDITDQRPGAGDYITALVGGTAAMLGLDDATTNGVGPYDGSVIRDATVHVFSQVGTGERDVANLCAVAAHEIGHSLGLDHSFTCGDVMSYFNDECGTQQFLDTEGPCGEDVSRDCANGEATQNSFRRLAQNVGLRGGPAPQAPDADVADDIDDGSDDGPALDTDAYDEVDEANTDADDLATDSMDSMDSMDEERAPVERAQPRGCH